MEEADEQEEVRRLEKELTRSSQEREDLLWETSRLRQELLRMEAAAFVRELQVKSCLGGMAIKCREPSSAAPGLLSVLLDLRLRNVDFTRLGHEAQCQAATEEALRRALALAAGDKAKLCTDEILLEVRPNGRILPRALVDTERARTIAVAWADSQELVTSIAAAAAAVEGLRINCQAAVQVEVAGPPRVMQGSLEEKGKHFVARLWEVWRGKKCSILGELLESLRMYREGRIADIDARTIYGLSCGFQAVYGHLFADARIKTSPLALLCMFLYTQQDVDIDRLLKMPNCPDPPVGNDKTPQERGDAYALYRLEVKASGIARNPQMFTEADLDAQASWDRFVRGQEEDFAMKEQLARFVKWSCLLCALRQRFDAPRTVSRSLTHVPDPTLKELKEKKPGDLVFWASASSTTYDPQISEEYATQQHPANRNVLFTINAVTEGLELQGVSQYPAEQELVLPPFSLLRVTQIANCEDGATEAEPVRIECDFVCTLMPRKFQEDCEQDLLRATQELRTAVGSAGEFGIENREHELLQTSGARAEAEEMLRSARAAAAVAKQDLLASNAARDGAERRLAELMATLAEQEVQVERLASQLAGASEECDNRQRLAQELTAELASTAQKLGTAEAANRAIHEELRKRKAERVRERAHVNQVLQKHSAIEGARSDLARQNQRLTTQLSHLVREGIAANRSLGEAFRERETLRERVSVLEARLSELVSECLAAETALRVDGGAFTACAPGHAAAIVASPLPAPEPSPPGCGPLREPLAP